jgi:hypothetical protein
MTAGISDGQQIDLRFASGILQIKPVISTGSFVSNNGKTATAPNLKHSVAIDDGVPIQHLV